MNLTNEDRVCLYSGTFPKFPRLGIMNGRIEGLWIMGQNYQTSGYYGAYPHGYLDRVMSMFPDAERILHVPSGSLPPGPYTRVDIRPECNPDILGDAHDLKTLLPNRSFDLVLVDPPYSSEDAEHYGKPMVRRNALLKSCLEVTEPGGWIVWLDQAFPMFSKEQCTLDLCIGMIKSTNHRVRAVFGFRKVEHGAP